MRKLIARLQVRSPRAIAIAMSFKRPIIETMIVVASTTVYWAAAQYLSQDFTYSFSLSCGIVIGYGVKAIVNFVRKL